MLFNSPFSPPVLSGILGGTLLTTLFGGVGEQRLLPGLTVVVVEDGPANLYGRRLTMETVPPPLTGVLEHAS